MGGLFGVASKSIAKDLFYGTDYQSHLGTEVAGIAFLDDYIDTISHDISNSQFKSEFRKDYERIRGKLGIGVISDLEDEQPITFDSNIGRFAIVTNSSLRNLEKLYLELKDGGSLFEKSRIRDGKIVPNQTEIIGELISKGKNIVDGIEKMYEKIDGFVSLLILSEKERSLYLSSDAFPLVIGVRGGDWAVASETCAFPNLDYKIFKFPDYREILSIDESGIKTRTGIPNQKKFCPFMHVYYGFPTSDYYGINAEIVRERCGGFLAEKDDVEADLVMGVADSGVPHAVGYTKRKLELAKERIKAAFELFKQGEINKEEFEKLENKVERILELTPSLRRPLIKFTYGWQRSYMPPVKERRDLIAKFKQVPNPQIIKGKRIIIVDDSVRKATQLQNMAEDKIWPYAPAELHARIASPPQLFPCIYDLSTKTSDLGARKAIMRIEGRDLEDVRPYLEDGSEKYNTMIEELRKILGFTTLKYTSLFEMIEAVVGAPGNIGLTEENICTYCWTGRKPA